MEKTKNQKYLFQKKKVTFTQKIFGKGLNAAGYILIGLKEFGGNFLKDFADSLPKRDSRFALMRAMLGSTYQNGFKKNVIEVNLARLKQAGLIGKLENKKIYYLTPKGEELVVFIKDRYSILEKPWDGKIRLVIFDIPEDKRFEREWLRQELLLLQYKLLQKSVYIGKSLIPDDLYQELIKKGIFEDVHIFTLENVDKEEKIRKLLED